MTKQTRAEWWEIPPSFNPPIQVYEREGGMEDTGLLDSKGRPLMRKKEPIGFGLPERR
jgi:hypothetical protein